MKLVRFGAMALLTMAVVASCSKYEEGSKFTLLSKKARLVGEWKVTAVTVNGSSQTVSNNPMQEFEKDGGFKSSYTLGGFTYTDEGTWVFANDKADLTITDSDGDASTVQIVRLASKDLKLRQINGGDTTIVTLEKQ